MRLPILTMNAPALTEFFDPEVDFWTCEPSADSIVMSILNIIHGVAYPVDWEQSRQKVTNTFNAVRYQEVLKQVLSKATPKLSPKETQNSESGELTTGRAALN